MPFLLVTKFVKIVLLKRKEDRHLLIPPTVEYGGIGRVYSTHIADSVVPLRRLQTYQNEVFRGCVCVCVCVLSCVCVPSTSNVSLALQYRCRSGNERMSA
jgi:hypothetical protein